MGRIYFVYMLTNRDNRVLYTGVTNDLKRRVSEHKEKEMINDYCIEMGIDNFIDDDANYSIEESLDKFKTIKGQRILLLELMILIHVDDKFNHFEEDLINLISRKFDITESGVKYASSWGKAASALREQALLMIDT